MFIDILAVIFLHAVFNQTVCPSFAVTTSKVQ